MRKKTPSASHCSVYYEEGPAEAEPKSMMGGRVRLLQSHVLTVIMIIIMAMDIIFFAVIVIITLELASRLVTIQQLYILEQLISVAVETIATVLSYSRTYQRRRLDPDVLMTAP